MRAEPLRSEPCDPPPEAPPQVQGGVARRWDLRRVSVDVLSAMSRHAAVAVAGLLMIPLIARRLGEEGLGAWALIGTSSFLLSVSDLGLTTVVHRTAAVKAEAEQARRAVGFTTLTILIVAPILSVIAYPLLRDLPGASAELIQDMSRAMLVAFPAGILGTLGAPLRGFALVRGGIAGLARARLLASLMQVSVTAAGLSITPSLVAPAVGLLASALIETAMTARLARSIDPALPLGPRLPPSLREVKEGLRGGAPTLTLNLLLAAGTRADILILSRVGSLGVVAAYGVASRAVEQSFTLGKQISTAMLPKLGDARARERAVRIGTGLFSALVWSGMAALAIHGQPLLAAWAGPVAAGPTAGRALALLGIGAALASTSELAASALTLGGRTAWESTIPIGTGCLVNVAISVALAPRFGVWAVAGGTILGNAISSAMIWARARRLLGWSALAVGTGLLPAVVAGAVTLVTGWALGQMIPRGPAGAAVVCVVSTALGCAAALLMMVRRRHEQRSP